MTNKRFNRIMDGRSYTIVNFLPDVPNSLRIEKDKMVIFNGPPK